MHFHEGTVHKKIVIEAFRVMSVSDIYRCEGAISSWILCFYMIRTYIM
jgi:hypothetical protein